MAPGFVAHALQCPHRGALLDEAEVDGDHVICPWHGYRFSLADGRAADGRRCRMRPPLAVERGAGDEARLVFPAVARAGAESAPGD